MLSNYKQGHIRRSTPLLQPIKEEFEGGGGDSNRNKKEKDSMMLNESSEEEDPWERIVMDPEKQEKERRHKIA